MIGLRELNAKTGISRFKQGYVHLLHHHMQHVAALL